MMAIRVTKRSLLLCCGLYFRVYCLPYRHPPPFFNGETTTPFLSCVIVSWEQSLNEMIACLSLFLVSLEATWNDAGGS